MWTVVTNKRPSITLIITQTHEDAEHTKKNEKNCYRPWYESNGWPIALQLNYEGRSINKLQNGAIPSVLKVGKIRNVRFVGNLILNIHTTFLDDDVIIVTSSGNRTQSICVLFSPSVYYRNSQVITAYERHWCFIFLSTYRPSSFKHLSHLLTSFWMHNAKNDAGCLSQATAERWLHIGIWCEFLPP